MCGILGQITLTDKLNIDYDNFVSALNMLEHRGPDDYGVVSEERFIFGHRRLSIIDLSTNAKQPMISFDNQVFVTFNGEIYNYNEIKEFLISKGYKFKTSSDTEVLLYSYYEWGINCVKKFIGMFAFAIYDKRKNESFLVRDRLGIKPLYYLKDQNHVSFSSEVKSILKVDNLKRKLNLAAVSSYLSFRYPILNDTFFEEIYSLAPGHVMRISGAKVEIQEYWNPKDNFDYQNEDKGEEYYKEKVRELLLSSVKYRMISDVSIGAFLSGGVDSSVISAIMAQESSKPVKTFTIGFGEDGFNEFEYANMLVNRYKTEHHEILVDGEDYFTVMDKLLWYKDAPLSVPNEIPLYLMSKELKKYITVVLSGEGADEIFGGYGRIFRSPFDYERMMNLDKNGLSEKEKGEFRQNFIKKYSTAFFENELEHFLHTYRYCSVTDKKQFLNPEIDLDNIEEKLKAKFHKTFNEVSHSSYYNKILYTFEKIHLVGLLNRVDMTTMAASVEARVPFVDHRLVEFAFTIPIKYKLKWKSEADKYASNLLMSDKISENYDCPKYILKKSYEEVVPNEILYRKKVGFPVPLNDWFSGRFSSYAKEVLLDEKVKRRGLFDQKNIESYLNDEKLMYGNSNIGLKIWMLLNIELFLNKYFN